MVRTSTRARRVSGTTGRAPTMKTESKRSVEEELRDRLREEDEKFRGDSPITAREQKSISNIQREVETGRTRLQGLRQKRSELQRELKKVKSTPEREREFKPRFDKTVDVENFLQDRIQRLSRDIGDEIDYVQRREQAVQAQTARARGERSPEDARARRDLTQEQFEQERRLRRNTGQGAFTTQERRVLREMSTPASSVKRVTDLERSLALSATSSLERTGATPDPNTRDVIDRVLADPRTSERLKAELRRRERERVRRAGIQSGSTRASRFNRATEQGRTELDIIRRSRAQDIDPTRERLSFQVLTRRGPGRLIDRPDTAELVSRGVIDPANTATQTAQRQAIRRARRTQRGRVAEEIGGSPFEIRRSRVDFGIFNNERNIQERDERRVSETGVDDTTGAISDVDNRVSADRLGTGDRGERGRFSTLSGVSSVASGVDSDVRDRDVVLQDEAVLQSQVARDLQPKIERNIEESGFFNILQAGGQVGISVVAEGISRYVVEPVKTSLTEPVGVTESGDVVVRTASGEREVRRGVSFEEFTRRQSAARFNLPFLIEPVRGVATPGARLSSRPSRSFEVQRADIDRVTNLETGTSAEGGVARILVKEQGGKSVRIDAETARLLQRVDEGTVSIGETRARLSEVKGDEVVNVRDVQAKTGGVGDETGFTKLIEITEKGEVVGESVVQGFTRDTPLGRKTLSAEFDPGTSLLQPKGRIRGAGSSVETGISAQKGKVQAERLELRGSKLSGRENLREIQDRILVEQKKGRLPSEEPSTSGTKTVQEPKSPPDTQGTILDELQAIGNKFLDLRAETRTTRLPTSIPFALAVEDTTTVTTEEPVASTEEPSEQDTSRLITPTPDREEKVNLEELPIPLRPRQRRGRINFVLGSAEATQRQIERTRPERLPIDVRERITGRGRSDLQPRRGGVIPDALSPTAVERITSARPEVRQRTPPSTNVRSGRIQQERRRVRQRDREIRTQEPTTRQEQREGIISRESQLIETNVLNRQTQEVEQTPRESQLPFEDNSTIAQSRLSQTQRQAQRQDLEVRQLQSQSQRSIFQPNIVTPRTTTPPTTPPPIIPIELPQLSQGKGGVTDVFVRRRGEFIKIADDVPLDAAKQILTEELDETAAASGYVADQEGNRLDVSDVYNKQFRRGKNDPFLVVEEPSFRISTGGELRDITFKGREKLSFNRGREPRVNFPRGI